MKKVFLVLAIICGIMPCFAEGLDEQIIQTEDKKCAIHYLTDKSKKLWSIEVNQAYCHEGWVHGFASVVLKDSLRRTAKTLGGYFHKGYWLSDFIGNIDTFYRMSSGLSQEDFVFPIDIDKELNSEFYMVARAEKKDGEYGSFDICPQQPVLLVLHQPIEDFKASLFQTKLIQKAQNVILTKCPETKEFTLLGIEKVTTPLRWILRGYIDLKGSEVNLTYQANSNVVPRPSELRHEEGENLITIPAQQNPDQPKLANNPTKKTEIKDGQQSAVDLALLAQVLQQDIQGKAVVYVAHKNADYSFAVTRPLPLAMQSQETLSPGWYLVDGVFQYNKGQVVVKVSSVTRCLKEWCLNDE